MCVIQTILTRSMRFAHSKISVSVCLSCWHKSLLEFLFFFPQENITRDFNLRDLYDAAKQKSKRMQKNAAKQEKKKDQ